MEKYIYLALIYISLPTLIAAYTVLKNKEVSRKAFTSEFLLAFIALLLMPLILNSIGNKALLNYFSDQTSNDYLILELIAYSCAVALAGKKVISTALDALSLSQVKKGLEEQQKEIDNLSEDQNDIIKKQVSTDLNDDDFKQSAVQIKELLQSITESTNGSMSVTADNINLLGDAESKKYINIYGTLKIDQPVRCMLTKVGKSFLSS
ncbi:MAG: hypothetical protein GY928_39010 [Colwellia sp.]|nr:hypothetical protein [Colwellia sp.]